MTERKRGWRSRKKASTTSKQKVKVSKQILWLWLIKLLHKNAFKQQALPPPPKSVSLRTLNGIIHKLMHMMMVYRIPFRTISERSCFMHVVKFFGCGSQKKIEQKRNEKPNNSKILLIFHKSSLLLIVQCVHTICVNFFFSGINGILFYACNQS